MCSRPLRPIGLPIYVARRPAAPFMRIAAPVVFNVRDGICLTRNSRYRMTSKS